MHPSVNDSSAHYALVSTFYEALNGKPSSYVNQFFPTFETKQLRLMELSRYLCWMARWTSLSSPPKARHQRQPLDQRNGSASKKVSTR